MVRRVREMLVETKISLYPTVLKEINAAAESEGITVRLWIREALDDVMEARKEVKRKQAEQATREQVSA